MGEVYKNYRFKITEDECNKDDVELYWGTGDRGWVIDIPKDRLSELQEVIANYIEGGK